MLAFLLLSMCGFQGGVGPPQSIYAAMMPSDDQMELRGIRTQQFHPIDPIAPIDRMAIDRIAIDRSQAVTQVALFARPPVGGMIIIGPPVTAAGSEVMRSPDGLFYVTAIVNGAPIRFLVDTGASVIVLRPDDARRAGVLADEDAFRHTADTAGGKTAMARVVLDEVVVGGTRRQALNAAVVRSDLSVSLLGQNWVAQLASLTISGDRMRFD